MYVHNSNVMCTYDYESTVTELALIHLISFIYIVFVINILIYLM